MTEGPGGSAGRPARVKLLPEPRWQDPPDVVTGGAAEYTQGLAAARRECRDHPRRWALVAVARERTAGAKLATNIRAGKYGFKLSEVWEATSRYLDDDSGYGVFVRYLGTDEPAPPEPVRTQLCGAVWPAPAGFRGVVVCTLDTGHDGEHRSRTTTWDDAGTTRSEPTADPAPAAPTAGADEGTSAAAPSPPSPPAVPGQEPPAASGHRGPVTTRPPHGGPPKPTDRCLARNGKWRCRDKAGHAGASHRSWDRRASVTWKNGDEPTETPPTDRVATDPEVVLPPPRTGPSVEVTVPMGQMHPDTTAALLGTEAQPGESSRDVVQRVHTGLVAEDATAVRSTTPPDRLVRPVRTEPLPAVAICTCGHPPRQHEDGDGMCKVWSCDCTGVTLAQALDS